MRRLEPQLWFVAVECSPSNGTQTSLYIETSSLKPQVCCIASQSFGYVENFSTDESGSEIVGAKQYTSRSGSTGRSEMAETGGEERKDEVVICKRWREWKRAD